MDKCLQSLTSQTHPKSGTLIRIYSPIKATHGCKKSSPSYQFNSLKFDSKKLFMTAMWDRINSGESYYCPGDSQFYCHDLTFSLFISQNARSLLSRQGYTSLSQNLPVACGPLFFQTNTEQLLMKNHQVIFWIS